MLDVRVETVRDGSIFIPLVVIAAVCIFFLTLVTGFIFYLRQASLASSRTNSKNIIALFLFAAFVWFGGVILYVSVFVWATIPAGNDAICGSRVWLTSIGLMIMLATTAARASTFSTIRRLGMKNSSKTDFDWAKQLARDVSITLAAQLILLIVWQLVAPYHAELKLIDPVDLAGEWDCVTDSIVFPAIQSVLVFVALLWTIFQIYRNWKFNAMNSQSLWLLFASYNFLMITVLAIPLTIFIPGEKNLAIIASTLVLLAATQGGITVSDLCFLLISSCYFRLACHHEPQTAHELTSDCLSL